jgi:hypothetical protein
MPPGAGSVPPASPSMPAHFMLAPAPFDPPGTAVTARGRAGGRSVTSWAMALMAFGICVGLGAFAVTRGNAGAMETGAAFVDPSRAGGKAAAATPPATPVPVPVEAPSTVGVPPVAVPAVTAAAMAEPATAAPVAAPVVAAPVVAAAPVAAAPVAAPPGQRAPVAFAAAAPPAVRAPAAPVARPAPEPPAPKTAAKGGRPGKGEAAVDEEQKKALKALQESQLETPF